MPVDPHELVVSDTLSGAAGLRGFSTCTMPKTFAPGSGTLKVLTPLAFNTSLSKWQAWGATDEVNEVDTVTVTATSSTFTITIDLETTAGIAFNAASAATVQAAIDALGAVDPGDVVVTGTGPYVLTFSGGNMAGKPHTVTASGASVVRTTTGAVGVDIDTIRGFVWPNPVTLHTANDVTGTVMLTGEVHYADVVAAVGATSNALSAALRVGPRDKGIIVQGLDQVR